MNITGKSIKSGIENIELKTATIGLVIVLLGLSSVFLIKEKAMLAAAVVAAPIAFLIVNHYRMALYLFVVSIFINFHLLESPSILFVDVTTIMLLGYFIIDYLLNTRVSIQIPAIYKNYIALFLVMLVCAFFSIAPAMAVTPLLRVVIQIVVIVALYNLVKPEDILKLLKIYWWAAIANSIFNIVDFVITGGGTRIFGLAGLFFDDLTMLTVPVGLAIYLWSESRRTSLVFGIGSLVLIFGMISTHARGPLMTSGWSSVLVIILSYIHSKRIGVDIVRRRIKPIFLGLGAGVAVVAAYSTLFATSLDRFLELTDTSHGTIWLRLYLWRASLFSFLSNPLTGIGPGAFRHIESALPGLKFEPARIYVQGLSAHNLFMHYLAESGLFGALAITSIFIHQFRTSVRALKASMTRHQKMMAIGLLGTGATMMMSIFYLDGWMWGQNAYAAPFFIALTAVFLKSLLSENKKADE